MSNLNEIISSLTDEMITPEARETLQKEVNATLKQNSQLYERAKRAEGFELDKSTKKWVKKEIKTKETPETKAEHSEFDYGQKAFLSTCGIKGADELAKVKEFMSATGKSLDDAVENKYLLADLKELRDDKDAKKATPTGSHRAGTGTGKDTVDYWINKGELPPADKPELRRQYINARYEREKGGNPFAK